MGSGVVFVQMVTVVEEMVPAEAIPFSIKVMLAILVQPAGVVASTLTSVPSTMVKP